MKEEKIAPHQTEPDQGHGSRCSASVLAFLLGLVLLANALVSGGPNPAVAATSAAGDASHTPAVVDAPASPSATLPPTPTARQAASAAALPLKVQLTPTRTAVASPAPTGTPAPARTATATATIAPPPTLQRTATATQAGSPVPSPTPEASPSPVPTSEITAQVLTILLIGGDRDYVLDMNTDSLIVAVVNRSTKQVSLLSIPRDLWVHIPTYGWGRINIAHRIGQRGKYPEGRGPGLLMRTIEENLGIHIDHWVRIGYEGFARGVDELGGVDLVVACPVNLRYQPPDSSEEQEIILSPGLHHLDGATALRYVRTRRGDTDFERAQRQQQFLKAVWYQFKRPETVLMIPALWAVLKGAFATDLQLGDALALAPVALELEPRQVHSLSIGRHQVQNWITPEGAQVLLPIPERVQEVVAGLYAPPSSGDAPAGEAARIQIWNGTERAQLALIAADRLRWEGLDIIVDSGPADRADYSSTQIIVYNDKPEVLTALTRLLGVKPANVIRQPDPAQELDLRVILGQDYDPCR